MATVFGKLNFSAVDTIQIANSATSCREVPYGLSFVTIAGILEQIGRSEKQGIRNPEKKRLA